MSEDGEASTIPAFGATLPERTSRPAIEQFREGTTVGRYRLKRRLGAGAMGVVWSARDPQLDRDVAIKLMHPELASDHAAARFQREARAMAKLSHRSVITVHDAGDVDGTVFLAMELVRGTTLGQLLRQRDAVAIADWRRWLLMLIDAGRGLAEAHRNGVLHRDFKPDNVLVDDSGRVCVGDFGLATLGDRSHRIDTQPRAGTGKPIESTFDLTSTGAILGTPLYMSPQQLDGSAIDARADQFAFCVALHEAMYGARPFRVTAEGLAAIPDLADQIARGVPEPPAETPVPRAIHDCIRRGLAQDPDARWPDMDALLAALERACRRPATVGPKPHRRGWPWLAGAIAVAAVAAVLILRRDRPRELAVLFGTPLNTRTAVSAKGDRFALASDVLEVRSADGIYRRTVAAPKPRVLHLEVDDLEVKFSVDGSNARYRWRYDTDRSYTIETEDVGGLWRGTTKHGELVRTANRGLGILRDHVVQVWPTGPVDVCAISPDRRRVAYIEGGTRFTGEIFVRDVDSGQVIGSGRVDEPTALAWLDDTTLVYATSTLVKPEILRAKVGATFGEQTVIYTKETGWFSDLIVGGGRLHVVSMPPSPRGRVIHEARRRGSDLDSVSIGLGWDARDAMVTWNTSNRYVGLAKLDTEPANATVNGDHLIATLRVRGGRRSVAVSLADGKPVWTGTETRMIAVRCAGDRGPPCFAVRSIHDDLDRVTGIDPLTGVFGSATIFDDRKIEDIAVRADGQRLAIVGRDGVVREVSPTGEPIAEHPVEDGNGKSAMTVIRSIAYDPGGGFVVAGTVGRNIYQVGSLRDGRYEPLDDAKDRLLMLVRPSSDGKQVVFITRGYVPELSVLK